MTMPNKSYNVLFLCTGNSARSIMAEALLARWGLGRFKPFSAGSQPKGQVHPLALKLLRMNNFITGGFRSKSWEEFATPGAPHLDFVFTVCDQAARETCPVWPGQPMTAHWGIQNPDRPDLPEAAQWELFRRAYWELDNRIKIFCSLPLDKLDRLALQKQLDDIGRAQLSAIPPEEQQTAS
jgi:arsenate reductase